MMDSTLVFLTEERIAGQARLTAAEIAVFASLCGDCNPFHHDMTYARTTRFGGIIASGAQLNALMPGLLATHLSQSHAALGLEFSFRFLKAIKAEERIEMEWEILAT